ncbi:hypothetical protein CK203_013069 [Vitis vinifera]|uniref:Uncharacterized protein n=1 Tax=Vitis vinifera TaxID=29760 RepID=A0A438JM09_VITVI|nr:hypothetical protein CK203_013069 [Vitis vinifera]
MENMSSSILLMEPMGGSFGRFLPACRTARCAAQVVATGGFESKLSSWGARCMGVCGSCGLMLPVSGMAPAIPGYIDSRSGLEFATWPLEC